MPSFLLSLLLSACRLLFDMYKNWKSQIISLPRVLKRQTEHILLTFFAICIKISINQMH